MNFWIQLFDISYPEILGIYRFYFEKRKGACLSFRFLLIGFRKLLEAAASGFWNILNEFSLESSGRVPRISMRFNCFFAANFGLMGIEKF